MSKRAIGREEALHLLEKSVIDRGQDWIYPDHIANESLLCQYFIPPNYIQQQIDEAREVLRFRRFQKENTYTDEQIEDLALAAGEAVRKELEESGLQQNGPACLVGQALSYVGLNYDMAEVEALNEAAVESLAISVNNNSILSNTLDWWMTVAALDVMRVAQVCNDRHVPWGVALKIASEYPGWNKDQKSEYNPEYTASADEQADRYANDRITQYFMDQAAARDVVDKTMEVLES